MKQWRLMIAVSMALLAGGVSAETPRDVNFVGSTSQIQQSNQAAIVVGVEDYDERLTGFRQLDYSADDAQLIGSALRSIGYSAQQIDILTDTKASKSVVLNRIRQRAKALGKDGTLLFFFSGHGLGRDDENYLATYGAVANDLVRDGLAVRDVVAAIHESGVRRAVLLLDACRNDPTPGSKSANAGFAAVNAGEGIQILLSTGRGEVSWEHSELQHGVFSYFLANGLRGGLLEFSQLADYVKREVVDWTVSRKVQTQKPFRDGEHDGGDFLLVSAATPSPPQPEPEEVRSVPPLPFLAEIIMKDRNDRITALEKDLSKRFQSRGGEIKKQQGSLMLTFFTDIIFDFDQNVINNRAVLDILVNVLVKYPSVALYVTAHSDSVGSDSYNMKLSQLRADSIKSYLVEKGISDKVIVASGLGESRPVLSNDTAEGRMHNRRVEIVLKF